MSTPHPERQQPAQTVFGTLGGLPIDACLPFQIVDSDEVGTARVLAATDLELSPDLLTLILFLTSQPGELAPEDDHGRWALFLDALLATGAIALAQDYEKVRKAVDQNPDPDLLLWWENCRDQVRQMFAGRPVIDQTRTQPTDASNTDPSGEQA